MTIKRICPSPAVVTGFLMFRSFTRIGTEALGA